MKIKSNMYVLDIRDKRIKRVFNVTSNTVKFENDKINTPPTKIQYVKIIECTDENFEKINDYNLYREFIGYIESLKRSKRLNITNFITYLEKYRKKKSLVKKLIKNLSNI